MKKRNPMAFEPIKSGGGDYSPQPEVSTKPVSGALDSLRGAYTDLGEARKAEQSARAIRKKAAETVKEVKGDAVQEIIENFDNNSCYVDYSRNDRSHSMLKSPEYKYEHQKNTRQETEYIAACEELDSAIIRATKAKRELMVSYKGVGRQEQAIKFNLHMGKLR